MSTTTDDETQTQQVGNDTYNIHLCFRIFQNNVKITHG